MGNYSYLPKLPICTATTVLPVNILLQYKQRFAKVLIAALFLKLLCVCV